jgi:hypothetical protein
LANETFAQLRSRLLLRTGDVVGPFLAEEWIRSAFRDLVEYRRWSWLLKRGQILVPNEYTTGTASITAGTPTVTITTGVVNSAFIGRQFRIGYQFPILTITDVNVGSNTLTLSDNWWPINATAATYSIYQAYVALPSDFQSFVSVVDPNYAQPVGFGGSVENLDIMDPQRSASGSPLRQLAYFDYFNGLPRYEMWPHQRTAAVYPIVYQSRPTDAFDTGSTVPASIPGDVLMERALMYAALWPGTESTPNLYFNLKLAMVHQKNYDERVSILEKQDNATMQQDLWYQSSQSNGSSVISASWMQSHGNF